MHREVATLMRSHCRTDLRREALEQGVALSVHRAFVGFDFRDVSHGGRHGQVEQVLGIENARGLGPKEVVIGLDLFAFAKGAINMKLISNSLQASHIPLQRELLERI